MANPNADSAIKSKKTLSDWIFFGNKQNSLFSPQFAFLTIESALKWGAQGPFKPKP